jgi:hypothetical protein
VGCAHAPRLAAVFVRRSKFAPCALPFRLLLWQNEGVEIVCRPPAFKHGIDEANIRKAFDLCQLNRAMPDGADKYLLIGFDRNGNLLEIIYNECGDNVANVFHAMRCRKAYRMLLNQ